MQFNYLVPELTVFDLTKSLKFYIGVLGFKVEYSRSESKFAFLSLQGSQLMLSERNGNWETGPLEPPLGRGINFQILVSEVEPLVKALESKGVPVMKSPWESWYRKGDESVGQMEFLVQDPDGYLLRFAQPLGIRALIGGGT